MREKVSEQEDGKSKLLKERKRKRSMKCKATETSRNQTDTDVYIKWCKD